MPKIKSCESKDWVSDSLAYAFAWGLPGVILIIGIFLDPSIRTIMWTGALVWKGVACLANAARCGWTHCYFTGPFFLLVALMTIFHGFHIVSLGENGWNWVGLAIIGGTVTLWLFTEKVWGKFLPAKC